MPSVEGQGKVPPAPVGVELTRGDFTSVYEVARRLSPKYRTRSDSWGQGLRSGIVVPGVGRLSQAERPVFAGKLAEFAVRSLAARRFPGFVSDIDTALRPYGDGGVDLTVAGLALQLKLRQSHKAVNLIKRVGTDGRLVRLGGEAAVFCRWIPGESAVSVLGWMPNRSLLAYTPTPSERGPWLNIVAPDCDLLPLSRLWAEAESRLELADL